MRSIMYILVTLLLLSSSTLKAQFGLETRRMPLSNCDHCELNIRAIAHTLDGNLLIYSDYDHSSETHYLTQEYTANGVIEHVGGTETQRSLGIPIGIFQGKEIYIPEGLMSVPVYYTYDGNSLQKKDLPYSNDTLDHWSGQS